MGTVQRGGHVRVGGRGLLLLGALYLGPGAVVGGVNLLRDAEGFGFPADRLEGSPFPDYTIPALFLLVVIGGGGLALLVGALRRAAWAPVVGRLLGAVVLAWLVIETLVIGFMGAVQVVFVATTALAAIACVEGARRLRAPGSAELD